MNKEFVKIIPDCIEKMSCFTPARHREFRASLICFLSIGVIRTTIRYIHEERMVDKQYKHEEIMFQMEHEEKMADIKANLLSRAEERKNEKNN